MLRHFKNFLFKSEEERINEAFEKKNIILTEKDTKIFFDNLKNPKEPSETLKKAKEDYDEFVKEETVSDMVEKMVYSIRKLKKMVKKSYKENLKLKDKIAELEYDLVIANKIKYCQDEIIKELQKQI